MSLLSDVKGKNVLDAGCGPGAYTEWLIENGATVTSVDYSEEMLSRVERKVGNKARILRANLNNTLDFFEDEEFDTIVSSMTLHYLSDWRVVFNEFSRIIRKNGELVFSLHHPFMDYQFHPEGNYFETELVEDDWPAYGIRMKFYRRPLSDVFRILSETEFGFEELLEPLPLEECRRKFPDAYATLSTRPWFICFKAVRKN